MTPCPDGCATVLADLRADLARSRPMVAVVIGVCCIRTIERQRQDAERLRERFYRALLGGDEDIEACLLAVDSLHQPAHLYTPIGAHTEPPVRACRCGLVWPCPSAVVGAALRRELAARVE